ncbi:MAG: hypothetical protein BMS9Abin36_1928 [Gammaproteobacteria bacterium]|nr:MAG: hypothetical protein BMS9Abin36_1928 [Gammaproteobacteria bacterium]
MPKLLTLSRAARLVGVSRGVLQRKISEGELATFEGMVEPKDLLRVFPDSHLEDDKELIRVREIMAKAFGRRVRERVLPDTDVLATRLGALSLELADTKSRLARYQDLIKQIQNKLASANESRSWLQELLEDKELASDFPESIVAKDHFLRVMSAHAHIRPSGKDFLVDGDDTLLEAALRAGLSLNYGCSNGNCGLCLAKLISGEIKKVQHHDYVFSEAEKGLGMMLLCSNTAVSDVVFEAHEANSVSDIPRQRIATRIKRMQTQPDDTLILSLQTPRAQRLRFLAGQSIRLSHDQSHWVTLPIASCPCDDRNLQFHLPPSGDKDIASLLSRLKPKDTLYIDGPEGEFLLDEESHRPIIFVALEHGFAPLKSLIEHAMAIQAAEHMMMYWYSVRAHGRYLENQCRAWSDALDELEYEPIDGSIEQLAQAIIERDNLADCDFYIAGPGSLVDKLNTRLDQTSHPPQQRHFSRLGAQSSTLTLENQ